MQARYGASRPIRWSFLQIDEEICLAYTPFGMKIENNREFVWLQVFICEHETPYTTPGIHLCMKSRTRQETLSGAAKLPHAVSNTSKEKLKGYMKGAMMRALDSSSSDLMLFASLQGIFLETSSLCYPRTLFRHALFELAEKYRIFSQYTQIVKLGRVEGGGGEGVLSWSFMCP